MYKRQGVDRPFLIEEVECGLDIDQRHIGCIITLEISDGSEVTAMGKDVYKRQELIS